MRPSGYPALIQLTRATRGHLARLGFSLLFALSAACGGSHEEAKAPTTESADAPRVGSPTPDLPSDGSTALPEPPKSVTAASTDNGADIIPPFSSGKEPASAAAPASRKAAGKGGKKAASKKKKPAAVASSGG